MSETDLRELVKRLDCGVLTARKISHEEAREAAQRLVNSHFGNADPARISIPARPDDDDDLVLMAYIRQQEALASTQREAE